MHIRKYDFDYGRRQLLKNTALGAGAGVLAPLWPLVANGADTAKAYPEELTNIEAYTKGKIKVGTILDASNVDAVKDLLDPIAFNQVKTMGRKIKIVAPVKDVSKLFPHDYYEATVRNKGKAKFDSTGNVVNEDGKPWIGGNPFPDAKDGKEATANLTLSWGRNDFSMYAIRDWDINPAGKVSYQYDFPWVEWNTTSRTGKKGPYLAGRENLLRYQSVFFTSPTDVAGTSFLSTWYYDQRKFPDLVGYLPAFKRVRSFPTNQRFEPLVPGIAFFLSDAWAAGDPMLTWGNYKLIERKPHLGAISDNWTGASNPNWERGAHGGPQGQSFWDTSMQLIPEVLVVEAEPTGYPRAPVGKKRTWIDARNQMVIAYITYDRRGEAYRAVEPSFGQYVDGNTVLKDAGGNPVWSWTHVTAHDTQANRISRFLQAKQVSGGYASRHYEGNEDVYNKYLTSAAMQRLGAV